MHISPPPPLYNHKLEIENIDIKLPKVILSNNDLLLSVTNKKVLNCTNNHFISYKFFNVTHFNYLKKFVTTKNSLPIKYIQ